MDRWHFNTAGEPGKCSASKKPCPFGFTEDEHYRSAAEARAGFERKMADQSSQLISNGLRKNETWADYDLEEMTVLQRMRHVLVTKHGWDEEDFEEMSFMDIESAFLDDAGEEDFRPTMEQDSQRLEAEWTADESDNYRAHARVPSKAKQLDWYNTLHQMELDDEYMSNAPLKKQKLIKRLKANLRFYEKEQSIKNSGYGSIYDSWTIDPEPSKE